LISFFVMDLRQLEALVAVADHGSFSAAADALATVQSNISTHVKKLERELGTPLVERGSGRLTEAGRLVVGRARRIQAELDALALDVVALSHDVAGSVHVGMIGTTARWLVPQLLELVPRRFPRLRLVVVEATTAGLDTQLTTGEVDLAVLNLPAASPELSVMPLFEEDLVLVVDRDHPLAGRERLELRDLEPVPLLLPAPGTAFRAELDAVLAPAGVELVARAEVDSTRLIASLTFEGCGPAILPATAVPTYLRERWRLVPVAGLPPRLVGVAQRRQALPSAPARALLDLLAEVVFDPARRPSGLRPVPPDEPGEPEAAASFTPRAGRRPVRAT
jgi:DNA-binding transcriptional LysR family regulator